MRAASIPLSPPAGRPYSDDAYEPIWAAFAAHGMPVGMHVGTGYPPAGVGRFDPRNITLLSLLTASEEFVARTNVAHLLAAGVFERYPNLHVVLVETGIGWMARMFDRFDSAVSGRSNVAHRFVSPLRELPSYYLRRQLHATFMDDAVGVLNRSITGVDSLLWSADFPHVEGLYGQCQETVDRLMVECSDGDASAMVRGNAARLYGLDHVK
jgi:predicted TIM-barrel fold metal-dependent hydrolase